MLIQPRTLAIAVLALSLSPAAASACEDEKVATQQVKLKLAVKALQQACVVLQQSCETAISIQGDESKHRIVPAGTRRPDWQPGRLIERDSIRLAPEQENQEPETWVKVSSRNGNVHSWRYSYKAPKKAKGRVVSVPGPRRS